jgi:hypothetical protein
VTAPARRRAAVIGSPVSHSLSPAIHRVSFAALGVDWTYDAVECREEEVGGFLASAADEGYGGLSVTMPLKEAVIGHLHEIDDDAALLRAVNCITVPTAGAAAMRSHRSAVSTSRRPERSSSVRAAPRVPWRSLSSRRVPTSRCRTGRQRTPRRSWRLCRVTPAPADRYASVPRRTSQMPTCS